MIAVIKFFKETLTLCFILTINCSLFSNVLVVADPIILPPSELGVGALILPQKNLNLSLTNSNVRVKIYTQIERGYNMSVALDGTYIIYNPDKTINVTLIAPFQSTLFMLLSNLSVTVNGADFEWYEIWSYDDENITY
ncbi:MAG: hypothetical protein ACTSUR_04065 [Candidatus Heimdallarchaeaceae archaeon]